MMIGTEELKNQHHTNHRIVGHQDRLGKDEGGS